MLRMVLTARRRVLDLASSQDAPDNNRSVAEGGGVLEPRLNAFKRTEQRIKEQLRAALESKWLTCLNLDNGVGRTSSLSKMRTNGALRLHAWISCSTRTCLAVIPKAVRESGGNRTLLISLP